MLKTFVEFRFVFVFGQNRVRVVVVFGGGNGSSRVRIELPNGVVIHVPGDLDGQRLGDVIMAAGQIAIPSSPMAARGIRQQEAASC